MTFFISSSCEGSQASGDSTASWAQSLVPARASCQRPVEPLSLLLVHRRLVAAPEPPAVLELLAILPEARSEPCEIRRTQSRGLQRLRHLDTGYRGCPPRTASSTGSRRRRLGPEGGDARPRVRLHRLDHVAALAYMSRAPPLPGAPSVHASILRWCPQRRSPSAARRGPRAPGRSTRRRWSRGSRRAPLSPRRSG